MTEQTIVKPEFTALKPNARTFSALVEFRTFAEMNKGPIKGRGFEWVMVEGNNYDECFAQARALAVTAGLMSAKKAAESSLLIIKVDQQWDADGKLICYRRWNLAGTVLLEERTEF